MTIRDSDTIPTPQDQANALEMFKGQDGIIDTVKIANTVARLHRKESHQQHTLAKLSTDLDDLGTSVDTLANEFKTHRLESQKEIGDIKTCLMGDTMGTFGGLIAEQKLHGAKLDEIFTAITGKDATTKKMKKPEKTESDPFWQQAKGVILFLAWLITTVIAGLALIL